MNAIDRYLVELDRALLIRGRARRRVLAECRDHLVDAAQARGEAEALRRFGSAAELAAALNAETAARYGSRSTVAAAAGVLAVAGSTLALLNVSDAGVAVALWAVIFFGAAQASAVSAVLAVLQAVASRGSLAVPAELRLLGRRNLCALVLALFTEFSAGAAVSGHGSSVVLLAGPGLALLALGLVIPAWLLARRLDHRGVRAVRSPLTEVGMVLGRRLDGIGTVPLLVMTVAVMVPAAFAWNGLDRGSITSSFAAAGIELVLVLLGFLVLGGALGLRQARAAAR